MEVGEVEQGNTVPRLNEQEEKIYVAIRVRPLNEREKARHDVSEWECISQNAIRFKNNGHAEQRSSADTYAFDRVFGEKCPTKQVYEQGIKEVALSVVRGINSSIFAYGQTSSGKTYTMTGITELAVKDIYEHIEKHKERQFIVKFSALEIYNEAVRDLLNSNSTTLRLLDDPEKGTVVDKLTEETLTERSRLQQLISKCAAERTTEETAMNETSSRSHQILRLTVESNPSDFVGTARSNALFASVNFVDLAGSERASQALSAGTRLREGSHINRSLLTLGTVIRKLSKERNGHIPYRDSKLTRILHNSLGGNARTAIICTISPARSQVEQSKNTLFFAGCAKQVTTNARVNIVMSDKVLVKQLQKELARMENELKSLNTTVLKERELQIEQMDKEIKELTRQRDLFQNLLQSVGKDQVLRVDQDWASQWSCVANDPSPVANIICENLDRSTSSSSISSNEHLFKQSVNSEDNFLLDGSPPTFVGPDPCQGWEEMGKRSKSEDSCNEVPCFEIKEMETEHNTDNNTAIPVFEESEGNSPMVQFVDVDDQSSSGNGHSNQEAPQHKTEDIKRANNHLVDLSEKSNDSFESEPCCLAVMSPPRVDKVDQENSPHPQFGKLEQNVESSSGNGHSNQDDPHQKTEDIIRNNDHLVDLSKKSNDLFESEPGCPGCLAAMSPPKGGDTLEQNVKSTSGNGNSDQDAPHQETEYDHLVDLSKKSNDSFESEPCCLAVMSPPRVDKVDQENSPHPQFGKLEQNVESSSGNGHSNQDAPHQKTEDIIRNNDHLVDLSRKSNDLFESEPGCPGCLAAMSPPKGGDKLEQNVKSTSGNGNSDQDALHQETEYDHLVDLSKKYNDSFESEPCCLAVMSPPQVDKVDQENSPHPQFGKLEQNVESSSGNGHSNQDAPHQKTEDIIRNNDHLVDLSRKSNDPFESKPGCPGCLAAMSPPKGGDKLEQNVKSSSGNGHSDQDAPHQETEDGHLVDLSKKSNDSFESEPCCLATKSPPQVDKVDQENSLYPQFGKLEQNVESSSGNGHSNQDAPHQKTEDIIRNNDHLVDLSRKSNEPFESEPGCPGCLAAMSPPKGGDKLEHNVKSSLGNGHSDQDAPHQETEDNHLVDLSKKSNDSFESESEYCCFAAVSPLRVDKVDQENSPHPRLVKLEQNVSPSFNKLDQEPMSPLHQSEQEELESMSPPQRDDLEQVSFKSSASEENEYSTSLVCFPEKLSEPKLRAKRRRYSRKSLVHERNASVEDVESVVDSDDEETSSVVNLIARMNESAKPKPADNDIDYRMVPVGSPQINKSVNRVKGLSFSGVWGDLIPSKFEMQQRDIIELWDACHVPLVHRSYFFLLIKGELSDSVYLDVELRRLSFLKDAFSSGNYITGEGLNVVTPNSSFNSLTRERKMLSKQVHKKFSRRGREELYQSWGIDLKTKHRSIQLAWLIWTDTRNLSHIRESAALVGKLVGFINTGETPKKTFGLGFLTRLTSRGSQNWNDTMSTP